MLEYKIVVDRSIRADNKPEAIEKTLNECARDGWRLSHVAGFGTSHAGSNVYMFLVREVAEPG